ncbi:hypothetical protein CDAR_465201 [Caerostris darwini]|uniref:Uncharacterized protein n=1 Tax=Caerostris darwini TaxID=1538125 RepID=A0AAV4V1Z4_9ARAC|nr:hypothetical protein CDAR_465201 [Caerostris darwini]
MESIIENNRSQISKQFTVISGQGNHSKDSKLKNLPSDSFKNPDIPNFLRTLAGINRMNKSSSTSVDIIALQEYLRPSDATKIIASTEGID